MLLLVDEKTFVVFTACVWACAFLCECLCVVCSSERLYKVHMPEDQKYR